MAMRARAATAWVGCLATWGGRGVAGATTTAAAAADTGGGSSDDTVAIVYAISATVVCIVCIVALGCTIHWTRKANAP